MAFTKDSLEGILAIGQVRAAPSLQATETMDLKEHIADVRRRNPDEWVDCYVLFASHTDAMQLYECVRAAHLNARISTTPRQARASCGVALLVDCDDALDIAEIARANSVPIEGIVALPNQIDPHRDVYC